MTADAFTTAIVSAAIVAIVAVLAVSFVGWPA